MPGFDGLPETLPPLNQRHLMNVLTLVGSNLDAAGREKFLECFVAHRGEIFGFDRLDSNEAGLFGTQLEYLISRQRDIKRPEYKWRLFVPVTSDAPVGAETWAAYFWDAAGMAEIVANYSDDIRKVATFAKKFSYSIETFALGYDWSLLDIERASMAGVNYKNKKSEAVRRGFEARFESLAAVGLKGAGITGLLNNANVPVMTAASVGGSTVWGSSGKSANDVLNDLLAQEDAIITTTKAIERPDTLLLPLAKFRYMQNTPMFTGAGSNPAQTLLKTYIERSANITAIDWWLPLDTADAAGTGPRALMYKRDPDHVHMEMPLAPTETPAQVKNLAVVVNSWCRNGGVVFEYPLSAEYMDGI